MARARIIDFEKKEFYQVPKWLVKVNGLQPADILIYMLAFEHWKLSVKNGLVNEKDEVYFYLTHEKLKDTFDFGKNQIIASLKRLVSCGALICEKNRGKATKYFIEDDISEIIFDISSLKKGSAQNKTRVVTENRLDQSEKGDMDQSEKGDINKNVLNKNKVNKNDINKNSEIEEKIQTENISQELKNKLLEFIEFRKEIKKPLKTYRSIQAMLNKIGKDFINEYHLIESIDESIMNEYQGVFPKKINFKKGNIEQESYVTRRLRELEGGVM